MASLPDFKKYLLVLAGLTSFTGMWGQFPVAVDVVYDFIKTNSIHRYKVDWGKVDHDFGKALASAHHLQDTLNAFVQVLKALDDVHSQIYLDGQYYGYWHPHGGSNADRLTQLMKLAEETSGKVKCDWLEDQYAYICLPGFNVYGFEEVNRYARIVRDSINRLALMKAKGFIIDLRLNAGGNVYPMISGLGFLIGEGEIAYEVEPGDMMARSWMIQNGNFVLNDFPVTNLDSTPVKGLDEIPVAVLIGPATASSGSLTAIAFKGRKHTFFIGEPTADGYTTSNGYFQFAPNLFMNFAIAYLADRDLNLYPSKVDPDILVEEGDDFEKIMEDQKIKRALLWLKSSTH